MQPAPLMMVGAIFAQHYPEADTGLAIASLAHLMEPDHLRLAEALRLNGSADPGNAYRGSSKARGREQRLVMHSVPP